MRNDFPIISSTDVVNTAEAIERIETINQKIHDFWSVHYGWAPKEAAEILKSSRLDMQVSLSRALRLWGGDEQKNLTDGELVLAWANLGALLEGSLMLFLVVYLHTYQDDTDNLKKAGLYSAQIKKYFTPDEAPLGKLIKYCTKRKIFNEELLQLSNLIRDRRNSIHAFNNRELGNQSELENCIKGYLKLLNEIFCRLPDPDPFSHF